MIDELGGQADDAVAMWKVRSARAAAWTNAKVLWALAGAPAAAPGILPATGWADRSGGSGVAAAHEARGIGRKARLRRGVTRTNASRYLLPNGFAGTLRRYDHRARTSVSVNPAKYGHGMKMFNCRPSGVTPWRSARSKSVSVHRGIPVAGSAVRFEAGGVPGGPATSPPDRPNPWHP